MTDPFSIEPGVALDGKRYFWDKDKQGAILGAYFIGYVITQVPGAWLSRTIGSVKVLTLSMAVASIVTLLTPTVGINLII